MLTFPKALAPALFAALVAVPLHAETRAEAEARVAKLTDTHIAATVEAWLKERGGGCSHRFDSMESSQAFEREVEEALFDFAEVSAEHRHALREAFNDRIDDLLDDAIARGAYLVSEDGDAVTVTIRDCP
ncbi:MAG: hypothetical protein AAFY59_10690 [Pseudomonadota bacterium]